jgi:protoheme IX farnesyltransferase
VTVSTERVLSPSDVAPILIRPFTGSANLSDYWALTKPEVNFLVATTTGAAFCLGSPTELSQVDWAGLLHTLLGTMAVASGAAVLNQWVEYPFDARMRRTARRPIAAARIDPSRALLFGIVLAVSGAGYLGLTVGGSSALFAVLTLVGYLMLYTPLKRISPVCTLVGALPGAAPTLIGWTAARGSLDPQAWVMFGIVFLWQFPHFMAIAWMYRDDYERAGYRVLPRGASKSAVLTLQTLIPLLVLLPVSMVPDRAHELYMAGSGVLTLVFIWVGARFIYLRTGQAARRLLLASVLYLPALLALTILFHAE